MTKGGYVDSSRRVRSLHRQQEDLYLSPTPASQSRTGLLSSLNKSALTTASAPPGAASKKAKQSSVTELPSVISVSKNLENKQKEYDKQMRLIEVCYYVMIWNLNKTFSFMSFLRNK